MIVRKSWIFFGHSDWFDDLRGLINKPHQWVQGDDRHCEGRKIGSTRFPYFHHFFQAFLISGRRFLGENSSDLFMIFQNDGKCRLKPSFTGTALFVFFWFQWFKNRFFKAFSNCPGCSRMKHCYIFCLFPPRVVRTSTWIFLISGDYGMVISQKQNGSYPAGKP